MRLLFLILAVLLLAPQVAHAQLYVPEYNLTYTLGEGEYEVEEIMRIKNGADQFIFPQQLEIFRGDAQEMEAYSSLYGSSFSVTYDFPTRFVLSLKKSFFFKDMTLVLKYKRKQGLSTRDKFRRFSFPDIGVYPYGRMEDCVANINDCKYKAVIKIVSPQGYQFGNVSPNAEVVKADDRETLVYRLSLLENISIIPFGFPVKLEFADYKTLAVSELTSAKSLASQTFFTINDANLTMSTAKGYDIDLGRADALLLEAASLYQKAESALAQGGKAQDAPLNEYYNAYISGVTANNLLRQANGKAAEAKNQANSEVQNALQKKIAALGANLSSEYLLRENITKALTENISQRLAEVEAAKRAEVLTPLQPAPPSRNYYAVAFFALVGGLILYGVANFALYIRREANKSRGTVQDFRVIGDLKRKSFKGFEQKVDTVKHEVVIAAEIRGLRKNREKYSLGIENLRKKKVAGELNEKRFEAEKGRFEKEMAGLDAKIEVLEAQLKEMKEKKPNEAGKADQA